MPVQERRRERGHILDVLRLTRMRKRSRLKMRMVVVPMTVVETEVFLQRAKTIIADQERDRLIAYLASNPEAGQVIPGTGGARKIRWAVPGKGKRGGARTSYYYHNEQVPLFLLDIYAKSQKATLSEADKRSLQRLLPLLVSRYKTRSRI